MSQNIFDRIITAINPKAGAERIKSRMFIDRVMQWEADNNKRKFDAASRSRHTAGWNTNTGSPNTEIIQSLTLLRQRSRDLVNNNAYAINAARVIPNNVVGTGIIPVITLANNKGDAKLKKIWKNWAKSIKCDYDGNLSLYGLQHLAMRTMQVSGECFIVRVKTNKDYDIPFRIQILEAEFLDTSRHNTQMENGMAYYGIEFDKQGRRTGYWIYDKHPAEFAARSRFVSASDVIHLYEVETPGQVRGIPFSKGSMIRMNDLDDYEFAERVRNKIAASFTAFVTMDNTDQGDETDVFDKMEPGAIMKMNPGEQVTFSNPPNNNGYPEYVKSNLRAIAAGNGITYEAMTNDLSNVNFSSGRMGWIEFNRNVEQWQWNVMVPKFCDGIMDWFIEGCKLRGYIPMNAIPTVDWTPPRRQMIDPYKEVLGLQEEIRGGLTSWSEAVRERGYNPEDLLTQMVSDAKAFDENNLMPSSDPRYDVQRKTDPAAMREGTSKTGPDTVRQ